MIIVKMHGGLANKMFQFAFYKNLEEKGMDVYVDDDSFKPAWDFENIKLKDIFPEIKIKYASPEDVKRLGGGGDFISRLRRKIPILRKCKLIQEDRLEFESSLADLYKKHANNDYLMIILCPSELYFKDISETIQENFRFRNITEGSNINLLNKLLSEESIAIHIRKGNDYHNPKVAGTCQVDYYNQAIKYMKDHVLNPQFYIFTDNKEWARENIEGIDYTLVDWNPTSGTQNYLDMQLMANAKHNIIANSTYSWWAAWLNKNPQKIVVGPEIWFSEFFYKDKNNKKITSSYIMPDSWIKL